MRALAREDTCMKLRRVVPIALILSLLSATIPAQPARAVSTASEIQMGQEEDKQVTSQYGVLKDPLLTQWVTDVTNKLWDQVARKDVPYNIKVLDVADVNAFSTLGGYVYVDAGTLDFVQSDDELAAVLGHETGHIERRHAITGQAKAQILDLLFGIASIFSPFVYRFGQLAEAGLLAKSSRIQELQADQYGLLLMSRAGYDPDAMVSFMNHLGAANDEHDSLVDKYLADHPGFPDRVAHLVGYPELDPTKRTNDQILVQALHDQDTARYNVATLKFEQVLKADPDNATALLHLGQTQIAIGLPNKGAQTLAQAAAKGSPQTRVIAEATIKNLREDQAHFSLLRPNLVPLRQALSDATEREGEAATAIALRRDPAKDQLKAVSTRIQNISYEIPDMSYLQIRPGSRSEAVIKNLNAMARAIDTAFGKAQEVVGGIGSLERNKESGLVKENAEILADLQAPLKLDQVPSESLAILPSYPTMLDDMQRSDGDIIRAVDVSRSSLALLDVGLGDLDDFVRHLGIAMSHLDFNGDVNVADYSDLIPLMAKANASLNRAAVASSQGWQLFNLARARQLQTRITLLGVGFPEDRYATLQYALGQRVKNSGIDYETMIHENLTPGEVVSAAIVAADTQSTPQAVIDEAKAGNRQIIDIANTREMSAFALEIFLGLVYLDYTDDPEKEAHPLGTGGTMTPPTL
jgi:predicted Zn-dependent protease